jgi:hypothetical protein
VVVDSFRRSLPSVSPARADVTASLQTPSSANNDRHIF